MVMAGGAVSVNVAVRVATLVLPAASRAWTVSTLVPIWRTALPAVKPVVPLAVPLPPRLFAHVTCVTPTLSDDAPPSVRRLALVLKVGLEVGEVMVTVGAVVSVAVPVPVRIREMVSPSAVKLTFTVAVAEVVGVKRTVTGLEAPSPARLNGLPETMLKGAETDTPPEIVPPTVFDTVKV